MPKANDGGGGDDDDDEWSGDVIRSFESGVSAARWSTRARPAERSAVTPSQYYARSALADASAAATASFLVSLPVSVIDRAIVQNAAGTKPLGQGLAQGFKSIAVEPLRTLAHKSFLMVFGVCACRRINGADAPADFATYMTANTFESIMAFPRADDREAWFAAERDVQAAHEQSRVRAC